MSNVIACFLDSAVRSSSTARPPKPHWLRLILSAFATANDAAASVLSLSGVGSGFGVGVGSGVGVG